MTFLQTLRNIRSDYRRLARMMNMRTSVGGVLFMACMPSIVALTLYRFSHYFYLKRLRFIAWPMWLLNQYLTGADIAPSAVIGESCMIGHPVGVVLSGKIGNNAMIFGKVGVGGGMGRGDIGAGDGLPMIGDDVVIGYGASVLGPVRVGDHAVVGAHALVIKDLPAGASAVSRPAQIVHTQSRTDYEEVARASRPLN